MKVVISIVYLHDYVIAMVVGGIRYRGNCCCVNTVSDIINPFFLNGFRQVVRTHYVITKGGAVTTAHKELGPRVYLWVVSQKVSYSGRLGGVVAHHVLPQANAGPYPGLSPSCSAFGSLVGT